VFRSISPRSRYNFPFASMASSRYALVRYLHHPVGQFDTLAGNSIRSSPYAGSSPSLPPRELRGTEQAALGFLEEACSRVVHLTSKWRRADLPSHYSHVFIMVQRRLTAMRELHDNSAFTA